MSFSGDARTPLGYNKRLRAVVQNILSDFAEDMGREVHEREIIDEEHDQRNISTDIFRRISRSEYADGVSELMKRSRGRELQGTFSPLIVGELFSQQSKPWEALVDRYSKKVVKATSLSLELILIHATDESTRDGLRRSIINPAIEAYRQQLEKKVAEIMRPHRKGRPITYNL